MHHARETQRLAAATGVAAVGLAAGGTAGPLLAADLAGEQAAGWPITALTAGAAVSAPLMAVLGAHCDRVLSLRAGHLIAAIAVAAAIKASFALLLLGTVAPGFDSWAVTFGQTVTEIEMTPTGGGSYRMQTRFARFQNVPEMLRMWHVFADVKTPEDLQLPTPELAEREDGERLPHTIVIDASPEVSAYVSDLGARAEQVRSRSVTPEEDNMLKISTDGRKAALDMRMVSDQPSTSTSKLDIAAEQIASIWRQTRNLVYRDPASGEDSPTPGALQLVFCDLGTPSATWNAYDALRDQLLELADRVLASVVELDEARFLGRAELGLLAAQAALSRSSSRAGVASRRSSRS